MSQINVKPLADRVLVEAAPAEEKTAFGIIIPDTAKEKPQKGIVIAVGPGKKDEPLTVKTGVDRALAEDEARINNKLLGQNTDEDKKPAATDGDITMEDADVDEDEAAALEAALAMSMTPDEELQPPVGPGLPLDFQGLYELFAVVTHKGRDADGGHYMGWVKAEKQGQEIAKIGDTNEANEDWFVFDDDEVSPCKTEDVLKLKGGGDWHMSYLNFYRAKK